MTLTLKQPVVIENRPGGGTTIGASMVAQAPPDGHSLFINASSFLINTQLMFKLPYDPHKDFAPLTLAASNPHVLVVSNSLSASTMQEFLTKAKAKGKTLSYGSFGNGSSGHLAFELSKRPRIRNGSCTLQGHPTSHAGRGCWENPGDADGYARCYSSSEGGKDGRVRNRSRQEKPYDAGGADVTGGHWQKFLSRSWWGYLVHSATPPEIQKILYKNFWGLYRSQR